MKSIRIAVVAPPWFCVPPRGYGGIEWVVSHLCEGLVARGHDVTLFASGGSKTSARLVETYPEPPSPLIGDPGVEAAHLLDAYASWSEFDIIHDHTMLGLIAGANVPVPVVHTLHGPVLERHRPFYARAARGAHLVCISRHQRSTLPLGVRATVIPNAVRAEDFPFCREHGEYLLFVGRMTPEKGVVEAIEIARRARMKLLILAKALEATERAYLAGPVAEALRGADASVLLDASPDVKAAAFRDAYATLFPISWPEPFGLVMIESMATGTPVIAFNQGSVPEVIDHGRTGFVCDTVEEAVAAVPLVRALDRRECRARVDRFFDAPINVARHESLYLSLITQELASSSPVVTPQDAKGA